MLTLVFKTYEVYSYAVSVSKIERYFDKDGKVYNKLKDYNHSIVNSAMFGKFKDALMIKNLDGIEDYLELHE